VFARSIDLQPAVAPFDEAAHSARTLIAPEPLLRAQSFLHDELHRCGDSLQ